MNRKNALGRALDARERFQVLDDVMCEISSRNKINLRISDGELFMRGTVHGQEYRDNLEDMRLIYMDYAGL